MTNALVRRLRPAPAARYIHPMALAAPAETGEHDYKLDVSAENAPNYLSWIAKMIEPHVGQRVLELGAGIGTITERYVGRREVVASDLSTECVQALTRRFANSPNVTVVQKDLREIGDAGGRFDSVVMINVLEHIEDDVKALSTLPSVLVPGGRIVIYVPALNALYGRWDRKVGHFRRYSKWRLRAVALEAGLEVQEMRYVNVLGIPAWFAFSRTDVDRTQVAGLSVWDHTGVPLTRALEERIRIPFGLNVLAVFSKLH